MAITANTPDEIIAKRIEILQQHVESDIRRINTMLLEAKTFKPINVSLSLETIGQVKTAFEKAGWVVEQFLTSTLSIAWPGSL